MHPDTIWVRDMRAALRQLSVRLAPMALQLAATLREPVVNHGLAHSATKAKQRLYVRALQH